MQITINNNKATTSKSFEYKTKLIESTPEFVGQLQNVGDEYNAVNADGTRNIFVLTILEKIKETILKFYQGSLTVL